jgi:hypothetical protein
MIASARPTMRWGIAALALALATPALAEEKPRHIEKEGFKVDLPKGWGELPDVANNAANAILGVSTDYTGGAMAAGDPSQGVMVVIFWIKSSEKMSSVRSAIDDYQRGIKESLDEAGTKLTKWEPTEAATQVRVAGEGSDADVALRLVSIAAVDKEDHLSGWTAQCIHGAKSKTGPTLCAGVLGSFGITAAEADLKPLEKKKKK